MNFPDINKFWKGVNEFRKHEQRDAMYKVATRLVRDYWGKHEEVTDGLGVLLLTWNQALYRYGMFDFNRLEKFLRTRDKEINTYRNRDILEWVSNDDQAVEDIFNELLEALISIGKDGVERKSPVAVAKALHLLAPAFFPLWDIAIAKGYGCYWYTPEKASSKYITFSKKIVDFCNYLKQNKVTDKTGVTLIKIVDEYNYSKFTQGWI
jgi:hypothetical protein